ncbi:MAG TPA: NAD(P)-dependent oxidoreductase, partial [Clostridium sp.]
MRQVDEANRCLLCKNPRCKESCPINTEIPEVIALYKEGKLKEAGEILFNNNPLSVVCALVCPHEDQCKGNCIRGIKGEPIRFHEIEEEISKAYLENVKFENLPKDKDRIAIIGGGPAGITIAFILAKKG